MENQQITTIGSFCLNEACVDYQKIDLGNVVKCGKTGKGMQRYRCKTCKKSFTETKGILFGSLSFRILLAKSEGVKLSNKGERQQGKIFGRMEAMMERKVV